MLDLVTAYLHATKAYLRECFVCFAKNTPHTADSFRRFFENKKATMLHFTADPFALPVKTKFYIILINISLRNPNKCLKESVQSYFTTISFFTCTNRRIILTLHVGKSAVHFLIAYVGVIILVAII